MYGSMVHYYTPMIIVTIVTVLSFIGTGISVAMDSERNLSELVQDGTFHKAMGLFFEKTLRKEDGNKPLTIEAVVCQRGGRIFFSQRLLFLKFKSFQTKFNFF